MKTRNGFVSNSSSSSFVIGSDRELSEDLLIELFKVPGDSLMYPMTEELSEIITKNSEKVSLREILNDYCVDNISDLPKNYEKAFKKEFTYRGWASDETRRGMEVALCYMNLNYESDELVFYKDRGY